MSDLRRYLRWFRPHGGAILLAAVLLSISAAVPGVTVVLLQRTVDGVLVDGRGELLGPLCLAFAALALVRAGVILGRVRLTKRVAWQVTSALRRRVHRHFLALADGSGVGSRLAALLSEVDELQYGVSALVTAARNPLSLVGLGLSAAWLAPALAPWALILVPAVAGVARWSGQRVHRSAQQARRARAALAGLSADQLASRALIEDRHAIDEEAVRFGAVDALDRDARIALEVERVLPGAATQVAVSVGGGLLLWLGGRAVLAGELRPGELLGFAVALGLMHRPLAGLAEVWALWQRSLAALDRVHRVIEQPLPGDPPDALPLAPGPLRLSCEGLVVAWDAEPVLRGVSLQVRPGEIVALIGPSGAGKSTLLAAISGRVEPIGGRVLLGEVPLGRVGRGERREAIALVAQRNQLLDRSIRENLRLGRAEATEEQLTVALNRAGADFALGLPGGLDAPVGEGGGRLSGGERQRLCLARALLGSPRVLLLDEATNQVDPDSERRIVGALRSHAADCAVLMVAHDAATAALADRVLELRDGRLRPVAEAQVA